MDRPFPAYKGDEPYVFVSYSHNNSSVVFPELVWLRESGFNIWYDEGIEAGTEWREELAKAIEGAKLLLYFVTSDSVQSENCRKEVNFAVDEGIPIVAIHLEAVELPSGLKLTLSDRQAILKHEIPKAEYEQKLQSRISSYLDQEIVQPVQRQESKSTPVLVGVAVVLVLVIGLFVYNQQTGQQPIKTATERATEGITSEQPTSNPNEKIDLAAMYSIAVLPFANMSSNEESGFLAEGLSEDILNNLTQAKFLDVASRSASFQFTDRGVDPAVIGDNLNVAYLLEGSIRQLGEKVRITAQLIRTEDGFHVWSKSYERTLTDGFDMQTEVATNIAFIIRTKLQFDIQSNYSWKQWTKFAGIDPAAIRSYFREINEYNNIRLGEAGNWTARIQYLERAVEIDPNFYAAYGRLANTYYIEHQEGRIPYRKASVAARAAIDRAIELAPDDFMNSLYFLPEIQMFELDLAGASAGFSRLLSLQPKAVFANLYLAVIAMMEGRTGEARRRIASISALDAGTDTAAILAILADVKILTGDYGGALQASTAGLKLASAGPDRAYLLWTHAFGLILTQRSEEAAPYIEEGWKLDRAAKPERYISLFAYTGETEKSKKILTNSRFDLVNDFYLALGYLALGDIDNTFESIKAGIEEHNHLVTYSLMASEWWDPIRDDPRFDEMLELLDSKITHTEQYLREHNITQKNE